MRSDARLPELLRRHAELEAKYGDGDNGDFLSGWQVENPWAEALKGEVLEIAKGLAAERYVYLDQDEATVDELLRFHRRADGAEPEALFVGAGASSLLITTAAYLAETGAKEIFYLPPLYFTMHAALRMYGIRSRPISAKHAFETGCRPHWPAGTSILLLCDPVWYAGVPLGAELMAELQAWQQSTGSLVIVDGSFQYMRWDASLAEASAQLPGPTIRILCPTKGLGLHGFRCAYTLMPNECRSGFERLYNYVYAPSCLGVCARSFAVGVAQSVIASHNVTPS
jgi:histidinol-phosphate/aromatic aminotransferase/cobyric acid decarboxylase-like protein